MASDIRVLQVSNISPSASKEQVYSLFSYIGRIDECKLYPTDATSQTQVKFAYVKFEKQKSVELAQHLTNVVFIDRALTCVPAQTNLIPEEEYALQMGGPVLPGQRHLPPNVVNQEQDVGDGQIMIFTIDPNLTALGLPPYPPLPPNTEAAKIEEIRRTVYVGNLEKDCNGDDLMNFFNTNIGEVMYLRMTTGSEQLTCAYAYIEFTNQSSVSLALQNNGIEYNGRCLRIQHSRVAIIKPQRKTENQALEEVEEAIKSNEAREKMDDVRSYSPYGTSSPRRRRTPSPIRRRSKDRDDRHWERSRSKSIIRRRSRSRDREIRRRSRSRDRRTKSPERRRSKSREKDRRSKKRSYSKEQDVVKKSSKSIKDAKKEKELKEKSRKDRKRSKSRTPKKERKRSRSKTPKKERREKEREKEHKKSSRRNRSPVEEASTLRRRKDRTLSDSEESPAPKIVRRRYEDEDESSDDQFFNKARKSGSKNESMDFEEETLRERLLERVKKKSTSNGRNNNGVSKFEFSSPESLMDTS